MVCSAEVVLRKIFEKRLNISFPKWTVRPVTALNEWRSVVVAVVVVIMCFVALELSAIMMIMLFECLPSGRIFGDWTSGKDDELAVEDTEIRSPAKCRKEKKP